MTRVLLALSTLLLSALAGSASGACLTDTTQANFQAGINNGVDLTTSPGDVVLAKASAGGTLDQQNTTLTTNGEVFSNTQWNAQTFTAGASGPLTRVDLNLFCYFCGSLPPPITVSIRATSGGLPSGADLAVSSTSIDFSGAPKFYTVNFPAPVTIAAGTHYAIVIRASATYTDGTLAFTNSAVSSLQGNDVYPGGAQMYSSGSTWIIQTYGTTPTADGGFKTYVGTGNTGYNSAGDLISKLKDSSPPAGTSPTWTSLAWTSSTPASTALHFQAAASNNATGPFNFVGHDGTSATFFANGASLAQFNGSRYLKYRAFLATTLNSATPTLNDATVCASSQSTSNDLKMELTDGVTTAAPGGSVTYAIKASNLGVGAVNGATVTDTFPASLTCNWTCAGAGGGTCEPSGSGNISRLVNLPPAASVTFSATCSIAQSASGTLTDTASIAVPAGFTDPVLGNNSATDSDTLGLHADIVVTMSDNVDVVQLNDAVEYVVSIRNAGPSNASININDTLPPQLAGSQWTCLPSGAATCGKASGNINNNTIATTATVPTGDGVTYKIDALVMSDNLTDQVTNTVTTTLVAGTDSNPNNNTASDTDLLVVFTSGFE